MCCRVVCHFPAVFRLNREWQLFVLNFNRGASELFALDGGGMKQNACAAERSQTAT